MQTSSQTTKLNEAVSDFEAKLGRLVETNDREVVQRWVRELRGSFDALDAMICTQRERVHAKLFRESADQDTSELEHIRELQDADEQIKKILDCVNLQLIVFSMDLSSEVEARIEGQGSEDEPLQDVIDRCTELIYWIREQEGSVTAWFAEAFIRSAATSETQRETINDTDA
ncbi:MAG: hypothetical protein ABI614_06095 [Planctomycetota bacterium]